MNEDFMLQQFHRSVSNLLLITLTVMMVLTVLTVLMPCNHPLFSAGHSKCVGLLRNWSTPSKENTKNSANIKPSHFPTSNGSPTDRHLSPTLPVTNDHSETTVDQSMAETFVSMYLNMTQVGKKSSGIFLHFSMPGLCVADPHFFHVGGRYLASLLPH